MANNLYFVFSVRTDQETLGQLHSRIFCLVKPDFLLDVTIVITISHGAVADVSGCQYLSAISETRFKSTENKRQSQIKTISRKFLPNGN